MQLHCSTVYIGNKCSVTCFLVTGASKACRTHLSTILSNWIQNHGKRSHWNAVPFQNLHISIGNCHVKSSSVKCWTAAVGEGVLSSANGDDLPESRDRLMAVIGARCNGQTTSWWLQRLHDRRKLTRYCTVHHRRRHSCACLIFIMIELKIETASAVHQFLPPWGDVQPTEQRHGSLRWYPILKM